MKRLYHNTKRERRAIRHARGRARQRGTAVQPRLSVFRGLRHTVAQLIDDTTGRTLAAASSIQIAAAPVAGKTAKVAAAYLVGQRLAEAAERQGIRRVVFDRGGYLYHGRVAAVAEGARAGGLQF
ncbi:MAG: 50S ribosomal protein L18 [Candidatus Magasanikbacteria bacterium]|nr:50S ribosomal protein L18 [Candidatus Magasanikbacteria bacterium]